MLGKAFIHDAQQVIFKYTCVWKLVQLAGSRRRRDPGAVRPDRVQRTDGCVSEDCCDPLPFLGVVRRMQLNPELP